MQQLVWQKLLLRLGLYVLVYFPGETVGTGSQTSGQNSESVASTRGEPLTIMKMCSHIIVSAQMYFL